MLSAYPSHLPLMSHHQSNMNHTYGRGLPDHRPKQSNDINKRGGNTPNMFFLPTTEIAGVGVGSLNSSPAGSPAFSLSELYNIGGRGSPAVLSSTKEHSMAWPIVMELYPTFSPPPFIAPSSESSTVGTDASTASLRSRTASPPSPPLPSVHKMEMQNLSKEVPNVHRPIVSWIKDMLAVTHAQDQARQTHVPNHTQAPDSQTHLPPHSQPQGRQTRRMAAFINSDSGSDGEEETVRPPSKPNPDDTPPFFNSVTGGEMQFEVRMDNGNKAKPAFVFTLGGTTELPKGIQFTMKIVLRDTNNTVVRNDVVHQKSQPFVFQAISDGTKTLKFITCKRIALGPFWYHQITLTCPVWAPEWKQNIWHTPPITEDWEKFIDEIGEELDESEEVQLAQFLRFLHGKYVKLNARGVHIMDELHLELKASFTWVRCPASSCAGDVHARFKVHNGELPERQIPLDRKGKGQLLAHIIENLEGENMVAHVKHFCVQCFRAGLLFNIQKGGYSVPAFRINNEVQQAGDVLKPKKETDGRPSAASKVKVGSSSNAAFDQHIRDFHAIGEPQQQLRVRSVDMQLVAAGQINQAQMELIELGEPIPAAAPVPMDAEITRELASPVFGQNKDDIELNHLLGISQGNGLQQIETHDPANGLVIQVQAAAVAANAAGSNCAHSSPMDWQNDRYTTQVHRGNGYGSSVPANPSGYVPAADFYPMRGLPQVQQQPPSVSTPQSQPTPSPARVGQSVSRHQAGKKRPSTEIQDEEDEEEENPSKRVKRSKDRSGIFSKTNKRH